MAMLLTPPMVLLMSCEGKVQWGFCFSCVSSSSEEMSVLATNPPTLECSASVPTLATSLSSPATGLFMFMFVFPMLSTSLVVVFWINAPVCMRPIDLPPKGGLGHDTDSVPLLPRSLFIVLSAAAGKNDKLMARMYMNSHNVPVCHSGLMTLCRIAVHTQNGMLVHYPGRT